VQAQTQTQTKTPTSPVADAAASSDPSPEPAAPKRWPGAWPFSGGGHKRNGKIARLPREIREELNERLRQGKQVGMAQEMADQLNARNGGQATLGDHLAAILQMRYAPLINCRGEATPEMEREARLWRSFTRDIALLRRWDQAALRKDQCARSMDQVPGRCSQNIGNTSGSEHR
jgi:hypothetical protein